MHIQYRRSLGAGRTNCWPVEVCIHHSGITFNNYFLHKCWLDLCVAPVKWQPMVLRHTTLACIKMYWWCLWSYHSRLTLQCTQKSPATLYQVLHCMLAGFVHWKQTACKRGRVLDMFFVSLDWILMGKKYVFQTNHKLNGNMLITTFIQEPLTQLSWRWIHDKSKLIWQIVKKGTETQFKNSTAQHGIRDRLNHQLVENIFWYPKGWVERIIDQFRSR